MKNKMILVTGGARSGKSSISETMALNSGTKPFYIATAPILDAEMADRVRRHKERRNGYNWTTLEEEVDLEAALDNAENAGGDVVLIDCLTLWINNLLYRNEKLTEQDFAPIAESLAKHCKAFPGTVVLVINEVGLGLVPESALSRMFRDLSGRCAQIMARYADEVYFMVAGIQQRIK